MILAKFGVDGQHCGSTVDAATHTQSAAIRFLVVGGQAGEQPRLPDILAVSELRSRLQHRAALSAG